MARTKSPLQIKLEYYPIRGLFALLCALPSAWGASLARGLIRGLLRLMPRRRQLIEANLAFCFPERSAEERRAIAERSIAYLARGTAIYPKIPDLCRQGIEAYVEMEGFHYLNEAVKQGRGAITFTAHYGFWEIMAIY